MSRKARQDEQKDERGQAERRDRTSRKTRQDKQKDETTQAERRDKTNKRNQTKNFHKISVEGGRAKNVSAQTPHKYRTNTKAARPGKYSLGPAGRQAFGAAKE